MTPEEQRIEDLERIVYDADTALIRMKLYVKITLQAEEQYPCLLGMIESTQDILGAAFP